jgi:hypothetical protein
LTGRIPFAEEAGFAYKNLDEVAEATELAGLSRRVAHLLHPYRISVTQNAVARLEADLSGERIAPEKQRSRNPGNSGTNIEECDLGGLLRVAGMVSVSPTAPEL